MPTTIYSETTDSAILNKNSNFATARGSATTSGTLYNNSSSNVNGGVSTQIARGNYNIYRSFFEFDLSGESGTVESADIKIFLQTTKFPLIAGANENRIIIVGATALADSTADFGNVFSSGSTLGASYSDYVSISTVAGYHTFEVNSDGLSAINSAVGSGNLVIGLMSYTFDHQNSVPTGSQGARFKVYYANNSGTSQDPKIELTYAATTVTSNATFFGTNF